MSDRPRPWVLKVGGAELRDEAPLKRLASRVAVAHAGAIPTVIVHGGGEEVTARADALGLPTQRIDGQRVTDAAMREVVVEVLAGRVNLRLVAALGRAGVPALGTTGLSQHLLECLPLGEPPGALGFVGRPTRVNAAALTGWLSAGAVPVLAPLGVGPDGTVYNVNADLAAGALAAALGADLSLLTDVPAVRGPDGAPIAEIALGSLDRLLASGAIRDGMRPKLDGAAAALRGGAASVWIGDLDGLRPPGRVPAAGTRLVPAATAPLTLPSLGRAEP